MADLRMADFDAGERILDWTMAGAQGRYIECFICSTRPVRADTKMLVKSRVAICQHTAALLDADKDNVPIYGDVDFAFAVPLTRMSRMAATAAVRPLGDYREDSEYLGNVLVTYRRPGWQSDPTKVVELDVLPYAMTHRMEVRTVLLRYLRSIWEPALADGVPCDHKHPSSWRGEWRVLMGKVLRGDELTAPQWHKYLTSLYLWDQGSGCVDCVTFDASDDAPSL